jgi:hypothetical protein
MAVQGLQSLRARLVGGSAKACPMFPPPNSKDRSLLLKEVGEAAKAHVPQFKLVKTVSELMAACREVLLKIKPRWPRILLTESFQQASLEDVISSFGEGFSTLQSASYSEPDHFKRHWAENMELDDAIVWIMPKAKA